MIVELPGRERRRPAVFLLVAFGWSWAWWLVSRALADGGDQLGGRYGALIVVGSFGPMVGALVATLATSGMTGVTQLLRRLLPQRSHWRAFVLASYVFAPAVALVAVIVGRSDPGAVAANVVLMTLLPIAGLSSVLTGPIGEELGWRGLLLPWLLERTSAVTASVQVGVVWAVWHLPLWTFEPFRAGLPAAVFIPLYLTSIVAVSFVFTWLHLLSAGSVAVAVLAHGTFNASLLPLEALHQQGVIPASTAWPFGAATVLTGLVAVRQLRAHQRRGHACEGSRSTKRAPPSSGGS